MADLQSYESMDELIIKYLSGDTTVSEVSFLEEWVQKDDNNRAHFIAMKKTWILSGMARADDTVDVDAAWQKVKATTLSASSPSATLKFFSRPFLRYAAALAVIALISFLVYNQVVEQTMFQYASGDDQQRIELIDGSIVHLNGSSSLHFDNGQDHQRAAELTGDAFFDIAEDTDRPFVITTNELQVEVLGTSFYVDARNKSETIDVIVESGRVAVRESNQEVVLVAGEKASYDRVLSVLKKEINTDNNFNSLKTGTLRFENTTLAEVIQALNRHYQVNITADDISLTGCQLTATYIDKSLDAVLLILESSLPVEISRQGNNIFLQNGCKPD